MLEYAERFNEDGKAPLVLVCDHASNYIPEEYSNLGLGASELQRHIAWDIGALGVARALAASLDAPLVYPTASRLILDCNRDPETATDSIPLSSEDTLIPGNAAVTAEDRARRIATIYEPFHASVAQMVARRQRSGQTALIAIHSFTPVYRGQARPWDVGVIVGDQSGLAEKIIAALSADLSIVVGVNEPYSVDDNVYHTLQRHGVALGLPTAMVELRQDHVATQAGQARWAARLAAALRASDLALRRQTAD